MAVNRKHLLAFVALLVAFSWLQITVGEGLRTGFYHKTCPSALRIIKSGLVKAVKKEPRMAASLLRLHFHDCFVNGCDGSVLLDDTANFTGEKTAVPNKNSARGFNVVDDIKSNLEKACPGVVSCADILAVLAQDGVALSKGPRWSVLLGRRDARNASLSDANNDIPPPTSNLSNLITKFSNVGLNVQDLAALAGAHTIGLARCTSFKARLYNFTGNNQPDKTLNTTYLAQLRATCPRTGTDDNNTTPLDPTSPTVFDNHYYSNIVVGRGLLNSDQVLLSTKGAQTAKYIRYYATHQKDFFKQFTRSIIKMGNIKPLTGTQGEIRRNCRRVN